MRTFWVSGTGTFETQEHHVDVAPATPSPPTQRHPLYARPQPNPPLPPSTRERHASAPLGNSPSASPMSRRHSLAIARTTTPKPNQWPMADQQLRRFSSGNVSIDPGLTQGKTAKMVERFQQQQTAPLIMAQDSLNKRQLERKLSVEKAGIFRTTSSSSMSSSSKMMALPHTGQAPPPVEFDLGVTPGEVLGEMELFAAQAEESARHARQLADWAMGIVNQIKRGEGKEEGTSVDATHALFNHSNSEDDESEGLHRQSSMIDNAKCILM